MAKIKIY